MTANPGSGTDLAELTKDEELAMLERSARQLLGISAEEFARLWASGAYRNCDDPKVTQVAMLLP